MQVRIFTIPVQGGEMLAEEMNVFLRSKKVLQVKEQLVGNTPDTACWCFAIRYVDDVAAAERERGRVDYREVLDEAAFQRFSAMREIRKRVAQEVAVPPYAVFTDQELAEISKPETLTAEIMKNIKGIGEKKMEKYGHHFLTKPADEKGK
jgi:superfamily II DNA helicase RecQ